MANSSYGFILGFPLIPIRANVLGLYTKKYYKTKYRIIMVDLNAMEIKEKFLVFTIMTMHFLRNGGQVT